VDAASNMQGAFIHGSLSVHVHVCVCVCVCVRVHVCVCVHSVCVQ